MNDLTLICETCGFPIRDDKGSLYVRLGDLRDRRQAQLEWNEAHPPGTAVDITELLLHPEDVHWRTAHDACRTDHDEGCYEIDEPRMRSWPQLAWWTAHLMEKNWLALSDWDVLLRELAGEIPAKRIRVVAREAA